MSERGREGERERESCGSTYSEKKVETRLRWFGHVERRPVDSVIRRRSGEG
jgi:hypothetical protein